MVRACCSASSWTWLISDLPSILSSTDPSFSSQLDVTEQHAAAVSDVVSVVAGMIADVSVLGDAVSAVAVSEKEFFFK